GLFDFWRKVTSRKFIVCSMTAYTFTTSTLQVTAISAWTVRQVDLQIWTFTQFVHLSLYREIGNSSYLTCRISF
ncbi:MAG: hypothetical protein JSW72_02005, partial [Candidatus Bathyarchaeota archaeon]